MWLRKTSEEIHSENLRRRLAELGCALAVIALVATFGAAHFASKFSAGARVVGLLTAGVILLAWWRRALWRVQKSRVFVCEDCGRIQTRGVRGLCTCGCAMIPMNKVKWIETPTFDIPVKLSVQH